MPCSGYYLTWVRTWGGSPGSDFRAEIEADHEFPITVVPLAADRPGDDRGLMNSSVTPGGMACSDGMQDDGRPFSCPFHQPS